MRCKSADGLILVLILQVLNRPGDSQGASNPTQDINLTELAQKIRNLHYYVCPEFVLYIQLKARCHLTSYIGLVQLL